MRKTTMNKLMWFALGAGVVVMNLAGLGSQIASLLGKNVEYGD